jgi:phosphopantothenate synthetase
LLTRGSQIRPLVGDSLHECSCNCLNGAAGSGAIGHGEAKALGYLIGEKLVVLARAHRAVSHAADGAS